MKKSIILFLFLIMALSLFGCKPEEDPPVNAEAEEIVLSQSSVTLEALNATYQIQATVKPEDAVDKTLHFQSMDAGVASVSETGLVKATGDGEAVIKISCGKATAEFKVIVTTKKVTYVFYNVLEGCEEQFYPTLTLYSDNSFEYLENVYEGMSLIRGKAKEEDRELILTPTAQYFGTEEIEIQYPKISLMILNKQYLQLMTPMVMSQYYDVLSIDKEVVELENYQYEEPNQPEQFWTTLHLYTDRSFQLDDNFLAGIEVSKGVFDTVRPENAEINDATLELYLNVMEQTHRINVDYGQIHVKDTQKGLELLSDLYLLKAGEAFTAHTRFIQMDE